MVESASADSYEALRISYETPELVALSAVAAVGPPAPGAVTARPPSPGVVVASERLRGCDLGIGRCVENGRAATLRELERERRIR